MSTRFIISHMHGYGNLSTKTTYIAHSLIEANFLKLFCEDSGKDCKFLKGYSPDWDMVFLFLKTHEMFAIDIDCSLANIERDCPIGDYYNEEEQRCDHTHLLAEDLEDYLYSVNFYRGDKIFDCLAEVADACYMEDIPIEALQKCVEFAEQLDEGKNLSTSDSILLGDILSTLVKEIREMRG